MKAITTQISWKKILEVLVVILTAIIGALTFHSCRYGAPHHV